MMSESCSFICCTLKFFLLRHLRTKDLRSIPMSSLGSHLPRSLPRTFLVLKPKVPHLRNPSSLDKPGRLVTLIPYSCLLARWYLPLGPWSGVRRGNKILLPGLTRLFPNRWFSSSLPPAAPKFTLHFKDTTICDPGAKAHATC